MRNRQADDWCNQPPFVELCPRQQDKHPALAWVGLAGFGFARTRLLIGLVFAWLVLALLVLALLGALSPAQAEPLQASQSKRQPQPGINNPLYWQQGYPSRDTHWYGGVSTGASRLTLQPFTSTAQAPPPTLDNVSHQKSDTGYKLLGGVTISHYLALEAGYFHLGTVGFSGFYAVNGPDSPRHPLAGELTLQGVDVGLVARLPLADSLAATGRIALTYHDIKQQFVAPLVTDAPTSHQQHDYQHKFGIGLAYLLSDRLHVQLELERYQLGHGLAAQDDFQLLSVGLVYHFY